jgi:succinyl-diaminopimelate desuccinylase
LRERLLEDLLFFLDRRSVTGSEKFLCDDLAERISSSPGWEIQRISNNLAVRRKEPDPSLPKVVLAGHLDTVPEPEGGIEVRVEGVGGEPLRACLRLLRAGGGALRGERPGDGLCG